MAYGLAALFNRLVALRRTWAPGYRPHDKAFGRWLGDFLDQGTPSGLSDAELYLLKDCINGHSCTLPLAPPTPLAAPRANGTEIADVLQSLAWLARQIEGNLVRGEFLRFLILGGDELAPIHEAGVQLENALIISESGLDLMGGDCVARVSLKNCILGGQLLIQDAKLGVLALNGSWLGGISGDRAKISGAVFLNSISTSGKVSLINAEIGGSLQCSGALFRRIDQASPDPDFVMLELAGAKISGPVYLNKTRGLEGTDAAPKNFVSDGGISLIGAHIGGNLDCSSATMLGPLNCTRATIGADVICQSGNFARGLQAQSAAVAGNVDFTSLTARRAVRLVGAKITGSLWCSASTLEKAKTDPSYSADTMLDVSQASIMGDVKLMTLKGKPFRSDSAVNFTSAKIGGDLDFAGAAISAAKTGTDDCVAINAQTVKVGGSVNIGRGFMARGLVSLYGAEISRDLDFSGGIFCNKSATAISANSAIVLGSINFQTINPGPGNPYFKSIGVVSLVGTKCLELICIASGFYNPAAGNTSNALALNCAAIVVAKSAYLQSTDVQRFEAFGIVSFDAARIGGDLHCHGGVFNNSGTRKRPRAIKDLKAIALNCRSIDVAGAVSLCNNGKTRFSSFGTVYFHTARIGQDLVCVGGNFYNPRGMALTCEASKISGSVFLGAGIRNYADENQDKQRENRQQLVFRADGKVCFLAASVGLNLICVLGYFRNAEPKSPGSNCADDALDFTTVTVGNTLFLGRENPADTPPVIMGSVNLSGATVRLLVDNGLIEKWPRGLSRTVRGHDASGKERRLRCHLILDQFTYERLQGDKTCDSEMRSAWLERQPPKDLQSEFKPQPFEQLVTVMRAMGYDDEADDIALLKRQTKRKMKPLIDIPEVDWRFPTQAAGVVAAAWLAILGDKAAWLAILGDKLVLGYVLLLLLFRKVLAKLGEVLLLDWFVGYGYNMARAVFLLLLLVFGFGNFYAWAFQQGAIVPADKDVRDAASQPAALLETVPPSNKFSFKLVAAPECKIWSVTKCPGIADQAIPLFNPWLYSADVMVPIVTFGQKAAWAPTPNVGITLPVVGQLEAPSNFVYDVQLIETVLGWVEGFLLVSFVTGLIAKE